MPKAGYKTPTQELRSALRENQEQAVESKAEHLLKKGRKHGYPERIMFLDTETKHTTTADGNEIHKMRLGWCCYISLRKRTAKTHKENWFYAERVKALSRFILSKVKAKGVLYVFGSNIWFDIRITKIDKFLFKNGYICDRLYSKNMITILGFRKGNTAIVFLSTQNIVPYSVEKIGEWLGYPKIEIDFNTCTKAELKTYCKRDVEIIKRFILRWIKFCMRNKMGTFHHTSSAQAFAAFRSRFMQHKIYIHHNKDIINLERQAYFGGRTECFYIGKVRANEIYKLDINSQYPYVMREQFYPTRLERVIENPPIRDIKKIIDCHCVVADLIIELNLPYIAHKIDGKTCFPTGVFRAFVCTRAFTRLLWTDRIRQINKIALYQQAGIFNKFINFFGKEKEKFSAKDDKVGTVIAKYYMNRLYGKWGQRKDTIVDEETVPVELLEYIPTFNIESGYNGLIISYGGVRRLLEDRGESSRDALVTVAAHVTEDARLLLWDYICLAGIENVYYCDTDSIFVNKRGYKNLDTVERIHPDKLGMLKVEETTSHCIINTCKDYEFGDEHKQKGIRRDAEQIDEHKYKQLQFAGLHSYLKKQPDNYVIQNIIKELSGNYDKGVVTKSGRVLPFTLS